jgi:hypothetical protein
MHYPDNVHIKQNSDFSGELKLFGNGLCIYYLDKVTLI